MGGVAWFGTVLAAPSISNVKDYVMAYAIEDHYSVNDGGPYVDGSRIPQWEGNGTPFTMVACHDTEGASGKAGALGTRQFFIDTAAKRNASYHEIWAFDPPDTFTVIRIVKSDFAAGSIAPQPIDPVSGLPLYAPTAWVRQHLGVNADDPNQGCYAVSIAGTVAQVNTWLKLPNFVAYCRRRLDEIHSALGIMYRAEHFQFNPRTRSDWGKLLSPALGGLVWQPSRTLTGYIASVGPGVVTGFHIPHGTMTPDRVKTRTWARASGAGRVQKGATGYWYVVGPTGSYAGLYLVQGKSGPFHVTAEYSDGTKLRVY